MRSNKELKAAISSADRLRMLKFEEVAVLLDTTVRSLERRVAMGDGPKVTPLSVRNRRIRSDHLAQWLDDQEENTAA
jgi:hypothetical protein